MSVAFTTLHDDMLLLLNGHGVWEQRILYALGQKTTCADHNTPWQGIRSEYIDGGGLDDEEPEGAVFSSV